MEYVQIPFVWDLWMKNTKQKLVCNIPTMKMVCFRKTCAKKYELWTYVEKFDKEVGICAPNPTKMNYDKQHVDVDLNLRKKQTMLVFVDLISLVKIFIWNNSKYNNMHKIEQIYDTNIFTGETIKYKTL